jgi:predicted aspartyl protease
MLVPTLQWRERAKGLSGGRWLMSFERGRLIATEHVFGSGRNSDLQNLAPARRGRGEVAIHLLLIRGIFLAVFGTAFVNCAAVAMAGPIRNGYAVAGASTVPMKLELDRPYINVELVGPTGRHVITRAWLDTGGGGLLLSSRLAAQLGIKPTAKPTNEDGELMESVEAPIMIIGGKRLVLAGAAAAVLVSEVGALMHTDADLAIPVRMLRRYEVDFDYPDGKFTIADAGTIPDAGVNINGSISDSGMPIVPLFVGGATHNFLLDTGATYTMISRDLQNSLAKAHPAWKRAQSAVGPGNMLVGDADNSMLLVSDATLGPFQLGSFGTVSRPDRIYSVWMKGILGNSISGSIGGNVLSAFKVLVDFPEGKIFVSRALHQHWSSESEMVRVTLGYFNGAYVVVKSFTRDGRIKAGDVLLRVGNLDIATATLPQIIVALSGPRGSTKILHVNRKGMDLEVREPVEPVLQ